MAMFDYYMEANSSLPLIFPEPPFSANCSSFFLAFHPTWECVMTHFQVLELNWN